MRTPSTAGCTLSDPASMQVLFDVESLLLDPLDGMRESLRAALREWGLVELRAQAAEIRSLDALQTLVAGLLARRDSPRIDGVLRAYARHFHEAGRYRCRFREGSLDLLALLCAHGRFDLHYVTHIGAAAARSVLGSYGLRHLPCTVRTDGEQLGCPRQRPTLIRNCIKEERPALGGRVLLSDNPLDLMAARQLGVPCIGLGYGRTLATILHRLPIECVARDLMEVAVLLHERQRCSVRSSGAAVLH